MKKLSKILCAVLVLAILCSSLIFLVGAEENSDYTSVATTSGGEIIGAIKYEADDNLLAGASLSTNVEAGWSQPGALQAHIVTNNQTGETYLHQFADGEFVLPDGKDGNEFINFTFNKVNLQYEEGYHEYIVVDYEVAYKRVEGTYESKDPNKLGTQNAWELQQQVIARDANGSASWATAQKFKDFAIEEFAHVTTVCDYATGYLYIFVNGTLVKAYENGALTAAFVERYLGGEALVSSEWRVGSNSYDDFKLANVYVRHVKAADAEDTLDDAIRGGNIGKWKDNIYKMEMSVTPLDGSQLANAFYALDSEKNMLSKASLSELNEDFLANAVVTPTGDSYIRLDTLKTGDVQGHFQWSLFSDVPIQYSATAPQYAIYDMDIGTETDLTALAIVTNTRTGADGQGWDVGAGGGNMFIKDKFSGLTDGFNHLTVILDYNNNVIYYFLNNALVHSAKIFNDAIYGQFKNGRIEDSTNWKGEAVEGSDYVYPAIKIQAHASYKSTPLTLGETFLLGNLNVQVLAGDEAGNLAEALSARDIAAWDGNAYDADYEFPELLPIAIINGDSYYSTASMKEVLATFRNENTEIVFVREPYAPLNVKGNVTIDTNGMNIEDLVKFDSVCSAPTIDGNRYTVTVPWIDNYTVVHKTDLSSLYKEVKLDHPNNKFGRLNGVNYNSDNGRWSYLVTNLDTGETYMLDKPGDPNSVNGGSNTYLEIKPTSNINYVQGQGQAIVIDMDAAVHNREVGGFNFISRYSNGGGAWGNNIATTEQLFKDVELGEFVHLTLMVFTDSRMGYYFVNNELVLTLENALTEGAAYLQDLRMFGNQIVDMSMDNICIREIKNADVEAIAAAGDLSQWSNAIYSETYNMTQAPALATVNGKGYASVASLNRALAEETEGVKVVDFKQYTSETVEIRTSAVVETHGLDLNLDWNTGLYEFDPKNEIFVSSETGLAYASSKLIHTVMGNTHTFTEISAENCMQTATPVVWYYDEEFSVFDVVFYVFGDEIAPINSRAYIEDDVFYHDEWRELTIGDDEEYILSEIVDEFPVAASTVSAKMYVYELVTDTNVDFMAKNILVGATVNSGIEFTVYVAKNETVTEGKVVVLNGVEYVAISTKLAPTEIDHAIEVTFVVTDEDGKEYNQLKRFSFLEYAADVLGGDYNELDKKVVAGLLDYANEAYALLNGSEIEAASALLEQYNSYVTSSELTEKLSTEELSSVIRSAALKLNATPEFVFKVARGFKGTIEFTYTGLRGEVKVSKTVDATSGEKLVVLNGFDVCDIAADITITATAEGAETSVSGVYNLATYAQGLEDNAFALALYNYSKVAYQHKKGLLTVTVDDEVVGEYLPGEKINVPFLRDGLIVTWFYGEQVWDFENDVITENMVLTYEMIISKTEISKAEVAEKNLTLIVEGKIKQFDGCKVSESADDKNKYGYFTKEGGEAKYVIAVKDGEPVEALYFSRTPEWGNATDLNAHFAEHRYALDPSRALVSFSFDYLINGTVGHHQAASGESYGEGIFQIKYTPETSPSETDPYKNVDYGNRLFLEDGEWHTYTYIASNPVALENILIKLYHFQGEMIIANINIEYAPLSTYDGEDLNTTTVLKDNVSSETLKTIVESKIKQCDQANAGEDTTKDYFAEGGTAAYVNAVKDGDYVEGLYFSRSVEWLDTQTVHFTEFRFAVNGEQAGPAVTSFSFDYIINGTVEKNERYTFTNLKGENFSADAYVQVKTPSKHELAGDNYPELSGTDLILDGEWHTMTYTFDEPLVIIDILLNLYHFQGEMVISNLVINYAE